MSHNDLTEENHTTTKNIEDGTQTSNDGNVPAENIADQAEGIEEWTQKCGANVPADNKERALDRGRARMQQFLCLVWARRRLSFFVIICFVASWGVLLGWWMPRGPLTTGQAMGSIFIGLAVGFVCSLALRTLWTLLLVLFIFILTVELMRLRVDGPTVDRPRLTTYGVYALASGRGVQTLLSLVPILVGCGYGIVTARRLSASEQQDEEMNPSRVKR